MSKKEPDKLKLLDKKHKLVISKFTKLLTKIRMYELENNKEVKKEGKKK